MCKPLFINLSNHPASGWSQPQLAAASAYGEITDIDFPAIDPAEDCSYVEKLAGDYLDRILELAQGRQVTVHLMGEMTFTYALCSKLKARGIKTVASTSARVVCDNPQTGVRTSIFRFVRFREY